MKVYVCDCGISHTTKARRTNCRQAPKARRKTELYRSTVAKTREAIREAKGE